MGRQMVAVIDLHLPTAHWGRERRVKRHGNSNTFVVTCARDFCCLTHFSRLPSNFSRLALHAATQPNTSKPSAAHARGQR